MKLKIQHNKTGTKKVARRNFIVLIVYIQNSETEQINDLKIQLKNGGKEQIKPVDENK